MNDEEDDKTITELGRAILKYMHQRMADLGQRNASYRKTRIDLLKALAGNEHVSGQTGRFNWGFEAVFAQELHVLEQLGLISVKYGSGAIMAGRTVGRKQIYGLFLTDDGVETAKVIIDREGPLPKENGAQAEKPQEETEEAGTESSTKAEKPPEPGVLPQAPTVPPRTDSRPTGEVKPDKPEARA